MSVTVLLLVSCSAGENIRGSISNGNDSGDSASSVTSAQEDTTGSGGENGKLQVGSSSANRYKNEFIGIGVEFDDKWVFKTDEEIKEINKAAIGMLGDDYAEVVESASVLTDMYATNVNETDTVNVSLEKLMGVNLMISEEDYVEASLPSLKGGLESMGITNLEVKTGTTEFAGKTHAFVELKGKYADVDLYEAVVVVKCSGYVAVIAACTWGENTTGNIISQFYAL